MKKAWKWILGIVLVLVVVAGLVAVPFALRNTVMVNVRRVPVLSARNGNEPMAPRLQDGRNFDGWHQPMGPGMGGRRVFSRFGGFLPFRGFFPFGAGFFFLGGLLRLLFPLGLLALVAYISYQMGRRAGPPTAPVTPAPASPPAPESKTDEKPTQEGG